MLCYQAYKLAEKLVLTKIILYVIIERETKSFCSGQITMEFTKMRLTRNALLLALFTTLTLNISLAMAEMVTFKMTVPGVK